MGLREGLQKKLDQKLEENDSLRMKIVANESYIQAIQEAMRMLDREPAPSSGEPVIRPGTSIAKAVEILRRLGREAHVEELLKEMGKPVTRNNKAALSGTLSPYVAKKQIFTRPKPNTFGLLEWNKQDAPAEAPAASQVLEERPVHVRSVKSA